MDGCISCAVLCIPETDKNVTCIDRNVNNLPSLLRRGVLRNGLILPSMNPLRGGHSSRFRSAGKALIDI